MKYAVTMPSLGADMDEGKLLEWHIKPGDVIKKGDLIAAVETQKAAVDIESFRAGTVTELVGKIDDVIRVGSTIAWMDIAEDNAADAATVSLIAPVVFPSVPLSPAPELPQVASHRLRVSPAARRLAEKNGIDLATIHGTGHEGAIELQDIESVLVAKITPVAVPREPVEKSASTSSMINVREAIARAMSRSKREIPHYYLQSQFNIDALVAWLDNRNSTQPPEERLFMPAVLMRAVVLALQTNPDMNGYYENGVFQRSTDIHLGITVALKPSGVMTPAIIDAQSMTLPELNTAFADLVQRARVGKLRNREMTDGTVTVTNVGDLGADSVTGVIFPPQVSLVGFGRVRKAPVLDGNSVRSGFVIDTSLSADHRVTDGLAGSKMLNTIGRLLVQPDLLDK
jgi:pyruvate dehydrogenase E2 component (dihydrolipoamide acetyltransferase)